MPGRDPVQVTVADIESLPGEDLEMRMLIKLRVQNPNDAPLEYDGVYVRLEVLDKTFATGVSDERGSIPRFGESVVSVPVSVSMLRVAMQALRMIDGKPVDKVNYKLEGKLDGPMFGSTRFQAKGEFALPGAPSP
jgi:LEA14-like dessication related protein